MQETVFTKIIKGEIPCHKIYEDALTFAFLDIHPIQPGQVLVVPKRQIADFFELPDSDYVAFFSTVKLVAKQLKTHFPDAKRIGVMLEGLDVDHVHAKIFPINTGAEYRYEPDMSADPDHVALAVMAEKLAIQAPPTQGGVHVL